MVVKRVAPLSVAKVAAILYALLGLCFGVLFSLIGLAGSAFQSQFGQSQIGPAFGLFFGAGAIIVLPIFYACIGFVFSLIGAALYNLIAGWVGGIEIDVQ